MRQKSENLYGDVRGYLCKAIYKGQYEDGELLPPERKLAEELGVSRVTVRRALDLLEQERIISRVQGSGTRVSLYYGPRDGQMDIVTVVAPAQNEFFSRMIDAVQTRADAQDSLVLFQQKPAAVPLESCLYRIYSKGLRNLILWKEDMALSEDAVRKLKGLGMNIVLFDAVDGGPYVDAVWLDNAGTVRRLLTYMRRKGCKNTAYVSWDNLQIGSLKLREDTFRKYAPDGKVIPIPYEYHNRTERIPQELLRDALEQIEACDSILYAVGELGMVCEGILHDRGSSRPTAMIGMMQGAGELGIHVIEQDFPAMADQIFQRLAQQNSQDSGWAPKTCRVKGNTVV